MQLRGKPILSVILPVYNSGKYLSEAIESILNQSHRDFELIIADDASSDNSRSIIEKYADLDERIVISNNEDNLGKTETVNRLFSFVRGKYFTVHDSDDVSLRGRFETQLKRFSEDAGLCMCGTSFEEIGRNGTFLNLIEQPQDYQDILNVIWEKAPFHGPTMIIKTDIMRELGPVYRAFFNSYKEDCDLAFRLVQVGKCINVGESLYKYRILPNSLSKTLTTRKKVTYDVIIKLARQREQFLKDDLMSGNINNVETMMKSLIGEKYDLDESLIYIETAELHMHYGLFRSAIINSIRAVMIAPFVFRNMRALQYCLRKAFFNSLV